MVGIDTIVSDTKRLSTGSSVTPETGDTPCHDATALPEEVAAILDSPAFRRAPILSRLLSYLLEKTLSGQAESLKAYTVAVEGLGRAPDFDAQVDSYPRVQMVRLRKALEGYYAVNPALPDPCVHVSTASYRLQLAPRSIAYPNASPLLRMGIPAGLAALPATVGGRFSSWRVIVIAAIALISAVGLAVFLRDRVSTQAAADGLAVRAPVVEVRFRDAATAAHSSDITDILSEALTRSWVTQIRDPGSESGETTPPASYRIVLREGRERIEVKLVDARSNMVLWTESLPGNGTGDLRTRLAPMIAELIGPFGVIARSETARLKPQSTGSFACILRYFVFVKARKPDERARVATCLEKPVDEPQLRATVAAVRSFFTLESGVWPDRKAQMVAAERFARRATDADAEDPYTHYAKARLAYLRSDCAAGRFYADRAVAANPYDSMIVTILAGLTTPCSAQRAGELLDQAYRIRNDNDVTMRSSLIFATIAQGQEQRLDELGFLLRPPEGPRLPGYLLTESILMASRGRTEEAKALWSEFQNLRPKAASDDERLKTVILSDWMRGRVLGLLRARGVVQP